MSNVNPKVQAAGFAGAMTVILVYLLSLLDVQLPPEVASAITTVIATLAGYLKAA